MKHSFCKSDRYIVILKKSLQITPIIATEKDNSDMTSEGQYVLPAPFATLCVFSTIFLNYENYVKRPHKCCI